MKKLNRWVYAIIGVIVLVFAGLVYAWSVISKPIEATFAGEWTKAQLSMTFTLTMAMFCIGCLLGGILAKKVKARYYVLASGVLFFAGFMLASGTQSLPTLYLGFGVMAGLASGLAYNAVMSTMSAWFPDKQGLVSGILLMGFGIGSFIIGKVYAAYTPSDGGDGWRASFKVFAIILLVVMVVCSFFFVRPGADFKPPAAENKKVVREPALDIPTSQMVRKVPFWLYYIWAILLSAAGLALVSQANGIAEQVGPHVSAGNLATVVGLISIMNGVGRVFFGGLFDKKGYRFTMILDMIVFIIASGILILALKSGNFAFIVLGFIVGGFAYSGVTPTNSAIISDFFGRTNYPMNFSLINTNLIVASFASTIAGKLYDASQSYMSTIFMMLGVTIVGFIVFIGIRRPKTTAESK